MSHLIFCSFKRFCHRIVLCFCVYFWLINFMQHLFFSQKWKCTFLKCTDLKTQQKEQLSSISFFFFLFSLLRWLKSSPLCLAILLSSVLFVNQSVSVDTRSFWSYDMQLASWHGNKITSLSLHDTLRVYM